MSLALNTEARQRLAALPEHMRVRAGALLMIAERGGIAEAQHSASERRQALARLEQRRKYADRPQAYAREVFGYRLSNQQDEMLNEIRTRKRLLIKKAENIGGSFVLGVAALWRFDAHAALPDPHTGAEQQGCRILLPGPDHKTIKETIYSRMLAHALAAQSRGWVMPGQRSELSVNWYVPGYPDWTIEALSPPRSLAEQQGAPKAQRAAGRHHRNLHAFVEEAIAVPETLWRSIESQCSAAGNTIVAAYNPNMATGPTAAREKGRVYFVLQLSALDHPNVQARREIVPGAVSHERIDELVKTECQDRGPHPQARPAEAHGDFIYALPPEGAKQEVPRKDGFPGHRDGKLRIYRPGPIAEVSILGRTASIVATGLFRPDLLMAAVERHRASQDPTRAPDNVGVDPAREGKNDTCAAPRWGDTAEASLRAYADAQETGPHAVKVLLETRRIRIGRIVRIPKGDGPETGDALREQFPDSPYSIDDGGVGVSTIDYLRRIRRVQVGTVSFGGAPPRPVKGERQAENRRTALYIRAAMTANLGLLDVPPDEELLEELLAHTLIEKTRAVEGEDGRRRRVTSYLLVDKETVKKRIGRSPDKADAFVTSLDDGDQDRRPAAKGGAYLGATSAASGVWN